MILVYDGECPLCKFSALTIRIREAVGKLEIIDARMNSHPEIMNEIKIRGINLDNSMVFIFNNIYYQGAQALELMANLSTKSGFYNRFFASIFKYPKIANFMYPILRFFRNVLLLTIGVKPLRNLDN